MGKQIRFFMTAEDEREFAQFVTEDPDVVFIPQQSRTVNVLEFSYPEEADQIQQRISLCIWNKRICGKVTMLQYSPESFAVRGTNEELVEFSRCFLHGRTMLAGRLYADMYFLNEARTELIRKGIEYEKWYDKLARWIRRHYTRDLKYGNNIGPRAREAYESGTLELAEHLTSKGPI